MSRKEKTQIILSVDGPVLPGSFSKVRSKCGKKACRCHSGRDEDLHGPYNRWSGYVNGRMTHRILNNEMAKECEQRIKRYRQLQTQLADSADKGMKEFLDLVSKK